MNIQDLKQINKERLATTQQAIKKQDTFIKLADSIEKSLKSIDPGQFKDVTTALSSLSKELKSLPNVIEKLNKEESDEMMACMTAIKESIDSKDFSPIIDVKAPKEREVDVTPIVNAIDSLKETFAAQEVKDDSEGTDRIVEAMDAVRGTISGIRFPVPNYILPYKDPTTGKATQVTLNSDGTIPVSSAARTNLTNQQTTITSSVSETTILTAVASTFLDLYGLIITNTSATNCKVTIKDATAGTTRMVFQVPATETRGFMLPAQSGHKQAAVNNNWTATCGTSVAGIEITALANKTT